MPQKKKILITSGDIDGIGLEVAVKALLKMKGLLDVEFLLYAHPLRLRKWKPLLEKAFEQTPKALTCIPSKEEPVKWVIEAAQYCIKHKNSALVTGPLTKSGIKKAGFPQIGHTEVLKDLCRSKFLFQAYFGSQMNVILATDHISLEQVPSALKDKNRWKALLLSSAQLKSSLQMKGSLAFLALDPHAGEDGVIGTQDQWLRKQIERLKPQGTTLIGPLPADSAFEKTRRQKVALYIALYHDQGLIPFKTLHGYNEGVHLTVGLPFVRTSVDHGTAKDLYGKNIAQPGSMVEAIKMAINLVGRKI